MKKWMRILSCGLCLVAVLAVAVWYGLSLLPLSPQGQMMREVMTQGRLYHEQMAALLESVHDKASADAAAASNPALAAIEEAMPDSFVQMLWAQNTSLDKTVLLREMLDTVSAVNKTHSLRQAVLEPPFGAQPVFGSNLLRVALDKTFTPDSAARLEVPQAEMDALLADTEQFLHTCATAADVRGLYASCAALIQRWNVCVAVQASSAETSLQACLPRYVQIAAPFFASYAEGAAPDMAERELLMLLVPVRQAYTEYLKANPASFAQILARIDALDAQVLELLEKVYDAESATAVEAPLQEAWLLRSRLYYSIHPLIQSIDLSIPERQNAEKVQQKIYERTEALRQLPRPFYGSRLMRKIFSWG